MLFLATNKFGVHLLTILTNSYDVPKELIHLLRKLKPEEVNIVILPAFDYDANGIHISPAFASIVRKLMPRSVRTTYRFYEILRLLGFADTKISDFDMALYTTLTLWVREGNSLLDFYLKIASALNLEYTVLPFVDGLVSTKIETSEGIVDPITYYEADEPADAKGVRFANLKDIEIPEQVMHALLESSAVILFQPTVLTIHFLHQIADFEKFAKEHGGTMICVLPKQMKKADEKLLKWLKESPDWTGFVRLLEDIIDAVVFDETKASIIQSVPKLKLTFYPISYETAERADLDSFVNSILKLVGVDSE